MLFDTHTHLNSERFDDDRAALIESLPSQGVSLAMVVGTSTEDNAKVLALAERYDFLYAAVGWHPHVAKELPEDWEVLLKKWAQHPRVRAIGEMGLDYHYDLSPRDVQQTVFEAQLHVARALNLPVIIHEREAHQDALAILSRLSGHEGVFHCYSGSIETARVILDMGFYIGFTGSVTFKNAHRLAAVAAWAPLDRILIETDCPFMAPEPHRGKRNQPGLVRHVGEKIAELKGITPESVFDITMANGRRLFRI